MRLLRPLAAGAALVLFAVSCEPSHSLAPSVSQDFVNKPWNGVLPSPGNGVPANENVELCKQGSDAKFHYTISDRVTGTTKLDSINIAAGQCWVIGTEGGRGELASISEDTSYLYTLNHVEVHEVDSTGALPVITLAGSPGLVVTDSSGGTVKNSNGQKIEGQHGFVAVFFNDASNGQIGDFVWNDLNGNGIQDAGEPGLPGLTVTLSGTVNLTTTTDAGGHYSFSNLPAGNYTVTVNPPPGFAPTASTQGSDTTKDSNGSPASVTLSTPNSTNNTIDFGFSEIPGGSIGDFVWKDLNGNGIQDAGEPGLGGITVTLSGPVTASTVTNGSGGYAFSGLPAGTYTVTVGTPAGYTASPSVQGSDTTKDSNGSPASVTLPTFTSSNQTIDFGFVPIPPAQLKVVKSPKAGTFAPNGQATFTIVVSNPGTGAAATNVGLTDALPGNGGLVWTTFTASQGTCSITSNNLSCTLGTIAAGGSVTVTVSSAATTPIAACTTQNNPAAVASADGGLSASDAGSLTCTPPSGQIGDFVWDDVNGNGIQDAGEPGLAGQTVTLSGPVNTTTTTDAAGHYGFTGLPAGTYTVSVGTPGGFTPSPTGAGTPATDNNGSPATVTLATSSSTDFTVDFGFKPPPAIAACTISYPFTSSNPRTSVVFNESEVLDTFSLTGSGPNQTVNAFTTDEHALLLGVRTTGFSITGMIGNPGHATNPLTGDPSFNDAFGRPFAPSMFITDITTNPTSTAGDWQSGGTPVGPNDIFGTWKGATFAVGGKTANGITTDADPAQNHWNLGAGSDPVPGVVNGNMVKPPPPPPPPPGTKAPPPPPPAPTGGFHSEVRWSVSQLTLNGLPLQPLHSYRLQFMVHDGDQNKMGGDVGEACVNVFIAP